MLRVKGAGQNSQCVRILFVYVVGVPREHARQNELSRHSITSDTQYANETTRAFSRVQCQGTLSIARISTTTTSDPFPSHSSRVLHARARGRARHRSQRVDIPPVCSFVRAHPAPSAGQIFRLMRPPPVCEVSRNRKRSHVMPCSSQRNAQCMFSERSTGLRPDIPV